MESLTAKRINMLEKAREEHTFNNVWSQDGNIMFFNKNTNKVKSFYSYFSFGNESGQLWEKNCVGSILILLKSFLLVFVFFTS